MPNSQNYGTERVQSNFSRFVQPAQDAHSVDTSKLGAEAAPHFGDAFFTLGGVVQAVCDDFEDHVLTCEVSGDASLVATL